MRSLGLGLLVGCLLAGCGSPSPVLGKWRANADGSEVTLEFRPETADEPQVFEQISTATTGSKAYLKGTWKQEGNTLTFNPTDNKIETEDRIERANFNFMAKQKLGRDDSTRFEMPDKNKLNLQFLGRVLNLERVVETPKSK